MGQLIDVLIHSPAWLSPILVFLTIGGVAGMYVMLKSTGARIRAVEETCKERVATCGDTFQRKTEVLIRHEIINGRLQRIEDKLDSIILKNGWKHE